MPAVVEAELDALVRRGAPFALAARAFARSLRTVPSPGRGDRGVLAAAVRERATVVTADRSLAGTLRERGVAVLVPRDRARLELRLPLFPPRRRSASEDGPRAPSVKKRPPP